MLGARNAELTRTAGALLASEARLAATSGELELTLASRDQGLVMVDAGGVVAVSWQSACGQACSTCAGD